MNHQQTIQEWIKAGAVEKDGIRLLLNIQPHSYAARLVNRNRQANAAIAVRTLLRWAGVPSHAVLVVSPAEIIRPITIEAKEQTPRFRQQFPFLAEPNCPYELKILAADKLSAYYNAVSAHQRLTDCTTREQCANTANQIVENWMQNDACFAELRYYADTRKLLGKHPIFTEMKKIKNLRQQSPKQLFDKQRKLKEALRRQKYEMTKNDKPHLLPKRQIKLRETETLLNEINRLINDM